MLIGRMARMAICAAIVLAGVMASPQKSSQASSADDVKVVRKFESRVTKYLDWRKKQAGSSPKPTKSSAKLAETEQQIAANVRALRAGAKQGDIFTPEIANYFRRQIAATLAGRSGEEIRVSLQHAEPVGRLQVRVNQPYPDRVPLQSTPPSLLLNLPKLPEELEYRIVDHDLVLHDIAPNLIVDFIPRAFPSS